MAADERDDVTKQLDELLRKLDQKGGGTGRDRLAHLAQIPLLAARNFWNDLCLLRASALTFTTLLSLVPFLALAFSILKGFGVQNKVEPIIMAQLSGGSQEVAARIIDYINNTNMSSLGAFGLLTLLFTVITLLGNIEEALNSVWKVRETRSLKRKFSDYLSVVIVAPILIVTAVSMSSFLQSQALMQWLLERAYIGDFVLGLFHLVPYLVTSIAMIFLYLFIPNTKVKLIPAIIGGMLAGIFWEFAQWGYIHFQVGVAKYNAIYGTMAILPIFMVWVYTSWLIVLFGAELVHAMESVKNFYRKLRSPEINFRLRELLALAILQDIVTAFVFGKGTWSAEGLEAELDLPPQLLQELLFELVESGLIIAITAEPRCFQPAKDPCSVPLADVFNIFRDFGGAWQPSRLTGAEERLKQIIARMDAAADGELGGMTLRDLAEL